MVTSFVNFSFEFFFLFRSILLLSSSVLSLFTFISTTQYSFFLFSFSFPILFLFNASFRVFQFDFHSFFVSPIFVNIYFLNFIGIQFSLYFSYLSLFFTIFRSSFILWRGGTLSHYVTLALFPQFLLTYWFSFYLSCKTSFSSFPYYLFSFIHSLFLFL